MVKRILFFCLLLALLAGCASTPPASPTIPSIPQIGVSQYALPLTRSLAEPYVQPDRPLPFDLVPGQGWHNPVPSGQPPVAMHIDFPPIPDGWFATPLGWEGIAVVVNPAVPIRNLSLPQLAAIYSGRLADWSELSRGQGAIQPILPPRGDSMRAIFLDFIMPQGNVTTLARLAPTPSEALQIASELEGAIAILPAHADLDEASVRIVRVEGSLPDYQAIQQGEYPLRAQIAASAPQEPSGPVRDWLGWLQRQQALNQP